MFCVNCGAAVAAELAACGSCGRSLQAASVPGPEIGKVIKEASVDALSSLKQIAIDPVGGLSASYGALGETRARAAGIAFGIAFAIFTIIASIIALVKLHATVNFKVVAAAFLMGLTPFASIALASAAARKVFRGTGALSADLFTAGVALQPVAVLFVLAALLGAGNFEVVAVLSVFAWTYTLCILFTGCMRLALVPERFAPAAVAAMLLLSLWLSKIIGTSFFGSTSLLGNIFR